MTIYYFFLQFLGVSHLGATLPERTESRPAREFSFSGPSERTGSDPKLRLAGKVSFSGPLETESDPKLRLAREVDFLKCVCTEGREYFNGGSFGHWCSDDWQWGPQQQQEQSED